MTPLSILQQKKNVLEDIVPHADKLAILLHKLRNFYFIDSTHNLRTGSFIRWVSIVEDEAKLHHGGFFCQIQDDHIKIKMFGNRYATALLQ